MPLLALGLNHQTADLPLREKFAVSSARMPQVLHQLQAAGIAEIVLLSTCNRTELYCVAEHSDEVIAALCAVCGVAVNDMQKVWYVYHGQDALKHLVRVAAGLDSMILGEPQILGQVKEAYELAQQAGTVRTTLHRLFQQCFFLAKKVRSETSIGKNPVSIAFAAATLAKHIFSNMADCHLVLLGAGDTIELTARHFQRQGVNKFYFVNRTLKNAQQLAEKFQAPAFELSELICPLIKADIIITATDSQEFLITKKNVQSIFSQGKPRAILLLDLAVPRNIDPQIANLPDCYLYGIDDLQTVVLDNLEQRRDAAKLAKQIIDRESEQFFYKQKIAEQGAFIEEFNGQVKARVAAFEQDIDAMQNLPEVITRSKKLVKQMQHDVLKFLYEIKIK
jgi:glutamyl-tRNA reductase